MVFPIKGGAAGLVLDMRRVVPQNLQRMPQSGVCLHVRIKARHLGQCVKGAQEVEHVRQGDIVQFCACVSYRILSNSGHDACSPVECYQSAQTGLYQSARRAQQKLFNGAGVVDRERLRPWRAGVPGALSPQRVQRAAVHLPLLPCSPTLYRTTVSIPHMKLSRKALEEGIKTVPLEHILGADVSRKLTAKQRRFAHEVAKGSTKADAYRAAYNVTSHRTLNNEPYRLADDPRVSREIEAYTLALETAKLRSPAALRELVIQSLVRVITDPDSKAGQITAAAKVLGTVTEVAAFTERKEVRTISSSEDARAKVMAELRALVSSGTEDATVIEADSLLQELAGNINAEPDAESAVNINASALDGNAEPEAQTPPEGHPPDA